MHVLTPGVMDLREDEVARAERQPVTLTNAMAKLPTRERYLAGSRKINGLSARGWQDDAGSLWLECGTPSCDGSPIDWAPYPWWNPKHPATKDYLTRSKLKPRRGKRSKGGDDDVPF